MSAPISPTEVCNLSLDLLRHSVLINNIEEPVTEIDALGARWYDLTRRAALRMFPWNFARERTTLSRISVAPEFGYADAYALPLDYCNYVFVGDDPVDDPITDFVIENGKLLIDNGGAAALNLCYVYDITNVAKFDPIFVMLLVGELAWVFGNSITGLNKSATVVEKFRDRWEAKARAKNGQENPPRERFKSILLSARKQGRSSLNPLRIS